MPVDGLDAKNVRKTLTYITPSTLRVGLRLPPTLHHVSYAYVAISEPHSALLHLATTLCYLISHTVLFKFKYGEVASSGGAPTPAGTSVFTKHNWDMGIGYLWWVGHLSLNGWSIYGLLGWTFMT